MARDSTRFVHEQGIGYATGIRSVGNYRARGVCACGWKGSPRYYAYLIPQDIKTHLREVPKIDIDTP